MRAWLVLFTICGCGGDPGPAVVQEAYIKASDPSTGAFGATVSLSRDGSALAVGASVLGEAYVFERSGSVWSETQRLGPISGFGNAVAQSADGTTLVVGASGDGSAATGIDGDPTNTAAPGSGAAYVFVRQGSTWSQQAYLKASNTDAFDVFGSAVAISADGNTVAIAATAEDSAATTIDGDQLDDTLSDSGAVYVFRRTGTTWTQDAYVKPPYNNAGYAFGRSVALSGDGATLAVGMIDASRATGIDGDATDTSAAASGAVYVFARDAGGWAKQAFVKASNTERNDLFTAVALSESGDVLAVGAIGEASAGADEADNSLIDCGAVYVFRRTGAVWAQESRLKPAVGKVGLQFGSAIALSTDGASIVVGGPGDTSAATGIDGDPTDTSGNAAGAAYLFAGGPAWSQRAYIKASNAPVGEPLGSQDAFGSTVAISGDANHIVVGAPGEDSSATGIDGEQDNDDAMDTGAVYAFGLPD